MRERCGAEPFKPNGKGKHAPKTSDTKRAADKAAANARLREALAAHDAKANAGQKRTPIATFDYTDADGVLIYQKLKYDSAPKYGQRRPDGNGGWISNLNGVNHVLYRLQRGNKDVSDWLDQDPARADTLAGICVAAPLWAPDSIVAGMAEAEKDKATAEVKATRPARKKSKLETSEEDPEWLERCIKGETGKPIANVANALEALHRDPAICDAFSYGEMLCSPLLLHEIGGSPEQFKARPLTDNDIVDVQNWMQRAGLKHISRGTVGDAICN